MDVESSKPEQKKEKSNSKSEKKKNKKDEPIEIDDSKENKEESETKTKKEVKKKEPGDKTKKGKKKGNGKKQQDKSKTSSDKKSKKRKREESDNESPGKKAGNANHEEEAETSPSKPKKPRKIPSRRIVVSGISEEGDAVVAALSSKPKYLRDFSFSDTYTVTKEDATTHVVVENSNPKRTEKVLLGISQGIWIVKSSWVLESVTNEKWIPENEFEVQAFPGAAICRKAKEAGSPGIFNKVTFYLNGKLAVPSLDLLILFQGGTITTQLEEADYVINYQEDWKPKKNKAPIVQDKWVIESIAKGKKLDPSKFLVK